MTARTGAAIASAAALLAVGCVNFYEIPVEIPIHAKLDITPFQRVLVAGFVSGGASGIDPNTETARLLRSQLRTKSQMRVIDADAIPLVEVVDRRRENGNPTPPPTPPADEPRILTEADLQTYEKIFEDADYWKRLGEEYQGPLIITGSVLFTEVSKQGMGSRLVSGVDQYGRPTVNEVRAYSSMKGFALAPKFVFIDGRTGAVLYSESFREEALYQESQTTPALSSYFELMDKLLPGFLNTLSSQKIRGTRVLLK
jgi:hypothetical protein